MKNKIGQHLYFMLFILIPFFMFISSYYKRYSELLNDASIVLFSFNFQANLVLFPICSLMMLGVTTLLNGFDVLPIIG